MSPENDDGPAPRIALITGANRGIGMATALEVARDGRDVIITYRSPSDDWHEAVDAITAVGRKAVALQLDLGLTATFDDFARAVADALRETWDRETFDYLVNNAGHQIAASFAAADEAGFDSLVNVHLKGVFFLTQKLVPLMADGGSVVNISSGQTRFFTPERIVYSTVKGAVEVFSRYLAQELGPRGITVNTIAPGATATNFSGGLLRDNEEVQGMVTSVTALGRYGVAEDVAGAIAALLDDRNRWVTGQRIEASGGVHL
jgi:NAD(P)-dependent dehydrogenase (short-subunit alcohol dehydrogenase family)